MDEPFAALDAQTRLLMQELLLELWEESRMTVIFVTHDIDEALFLSDRVILLSRRPAQVMAELSVELPRPRDAAALTHPEFVRKKRECLEQLRAEVGATRRHATNGEARCPGCHVSHDRFS